MRLRGIEVAFLKIDRAQEDFRQLMVGNQGLYTGKYVACRLKILGIAIDDARLKEKCDFLVRGSDRPPGCHAQLLCALPGLLDVPYSCHGGIVPRLQDRRGSFKGTLL